MPFTMSVSTRRSGALCSMFWGRFPALKARLKAAVMAGDTLAPAISPLVSAGVANLGTPHARQIYTVLKNKMDRRKKRS